MYNALIADDDRIIREDIRTLVDWEKLGFRLVAEASNGEDALSMIEAHSIDLVLTDMNMPKMDGVELIKRAKDAKRPLKFLVMSNYDDFEYVKEAMRYGAVDYVLKYKLDKALLTSLLQSLNREMTREKQENEYRDKLLKIGERGRDTFILQFWNGLLEGRYSESSMAEAARELELTIAKKAYVAISVEVDPADRSALDRLSMNTVVDAAAVVPRSQGHVVYILAFDQRSYLFVQNESYQFSQRLKRMLDDQGIRALVAKGDVCFKAYELSASLDKLSRCQTEAYYSGYEYVLDASSAREAGTADENRLEQMEQTVMYAIQSKRPSDAAASLRELFSYIREERPRPDAVRNFLSMFVHQLQKKLKASGFPPPAAYSAGRIVEIAGERLGSLAAIQREVELYVRGCLAASEGQEEAKAYRGEIVKAIDYMRQKYQEDISLNDIADHVGLSKSHFCKLFKQETGENFVNYLNLIRLEEAKRLILQGHTGVQYIASQVGIGNYRYFSKLFKQVTGQRPMDYKQRNG